MASADFSPALTEKLSPGKALILFLRAVRLYLARLVWILGFAVASTLTARTRPLCRFVFLQSKYSFPASFGFHRAACAPRLPLCGSLRLPPSVPAGSFHPARISPCWAHWRAPPAVPCRHSWRHVLSPRGLSGGGAPSRRPQRAPAPRSNPRLEGLRESNRLGYVHTLSTAGRFWLYTVLNRESVSCRGLWRAAKPRLLPRAAR